jgi:drug/metabolite transporter (DMT)-like permease
VTAPAPRLRVDLLLFLVAASWGSTYLVAKELVSTTSVVALLAVRMLLAAAAMAAVVGLRRGRVTAAEVRVGVVLGLLLAVVFVLETFGIAHTSATNAGVVISLTMVLTPVLDAAVSGRRLPGRFFGAAATAVVGVALLAGNGALGSLAAGDLLILLAAVARAVHVTVMARLTGGRPLDSLRLTTVQLTTCAALFCLASLLHGDSVPHLVAGLDVTDGALLMYLVLVCTVFAFFVQTWAVRRTSPSRVSLLLGTEPVWAAVCGLAIARDEVSATGVCGIVLILAGTAWGRAVEQRHRLQTTEGPAGAVPVGPSGDASSDQSRSKRSSSMTLVQASTNARTNRSRPRSPE